MNWTITSASLLRLGNIIWSNHEFISETKRCTNKGRESSISKLFDTLVPQDFIPLSVIGVRNMHTLFAQ